MAWSLPSDAICAAAYEGHTLTHDATSAVEGRHRAGEKSPPDSGDLRGYPDRVPPSPARTDRPPRPGRRAGPRRREEDDDHLGARRQRKDLAAARVGRPSGSGPPDRLHVGAARPA